MNLPHARPTLLLMFLLTCLPVSAIAKAEGDATRKPIISDAMEMTFATTGVTVETVRGGAGS